MSWKLCFYLQQTMPTSHATSIQQQSPCGAEAKRFSLQSRSSTGLTCVLVRERNISQKQASEARTKHLDGRLSTRERTEDRQRERERSRCERQTCKVIIPIVNKWLHRKPKKEFSICCVYTQCISKWGYSSVAEHSTADREVAGSTPAGPCHNSFCPSKSPSSLPLCLKFLISNFLQYLLIFYIIT